MYCVYFLLCFEPVTNFFLKTVMMMLEIVIIDLNMIIMFI